MIKWHNFERFGAMGDGQLTPLHEAIGDRLNQLNDTVSNVSDKMRSMPTMGKIKRRAVVEYGKGAVSNTGTRMRNIGRILTNRPRVPVTPMTRNRAGIRATKHEFSKWLGR
jgi:hypothetical protein